MTQPLNTEPFNSMDPEIKLDFVEALRSGRYKKTKGVLHRIKDGTECFCVLGVLTDLAVQRDVVRWEPSPYNKSSFGVRLDPNKEYIEDGFLVARVAQWAGVRVEYGDIKLSKWSDSALMTLNDRFDYSFEQMADLIEEAL